MQEINDLITLNLDIERFVKDVIAQSEGPELLRAFWHALYGNQGRSDIGISVLDPTCGSGAFLFAALNILEPLYTACLEGMRGFLDDAESPSASAALSTWGTFAASLSKWTSTLARNKETSTAISATSFSSPLCSTISTASTSWKKLSKYVSCALFLKLVAQLETYDQIEPLPDIDFNIRAGNTWWASRHWTPCSRP